MVKLADILKYYQPTKFIVTSDSYSSENKIPVLTAGKSFILGYTNETDGVFNDLPAIIFDDFTTAFHYVDFPFKVKSSAMKILVARNKEINLKYVYYRMKCLKVDTDLHKRYWISKYSLLTIPLPPLETQKGIAQILDDAQALKQKTEQLLNEYDALAQAIFLDMFGLTRRLENNWKEVTIKDIAANKKGAMRTGPFGSDLLHSEFVEEGVPVLGIDNAVMNKFEWKERRYITKEKYETLKRYTVFPNDIIITIMGTIGKVAVVPKDIGIAINTKHLAAITLNYSVANPQFIAYSLYSDPYIIWQINSQGRGAIMTGLNLTIIKSLKLFLPPISLQNQFAEKIALIEKQKELVKQELKETEDLFNCLLQKAFKGELK